MPEKFWDTYKDKDIAPAVHRTMPAAVPDLACIINFRIGLENGTQYAWNPKEHPVPVEVQLLVRKHYYAAISYMDHGVGQLLQGLSDRGFEQNTIVIMHADHGYYMGESGEWEKKMLFENTARVPLLIHDPAHVPSTMRRTEVLTELIDLYPTVVALAGLPAPLGLDGVDLSSVFGGPYVATAGLNLDQKAAFTQYPRCDGGLDTIAHRTCLYLNNTVFQHMGYSVRTSVFRYTEWRKWLGDKLAADWTSKPDYLELYNHTGHFADSVGNFDFEQLNLAASSTVASHAPLISELAKLLRTRFGPSA